MIACGNVISQSEITGMHECIPYGVNVQQTTIFLTIEHKKFRYRISCILYLVSRISYLVSHISYLVSSVSSASIARSAIPWILAMAMP